MSETMEDIMNKKRELVAAKNKVMSKNIEPNRNLMPDIPKPKEQVVNDTKPIPGLITRPKKQRKKDHYVWWLLMSWEEVLKRLDSIESIIEYLQDASEQENYSADLLRTVVRKAAKGLRDLQWVGKIF